MGATRRCPRCPRLIPAGTRYCATHAREYEERRGTRQQRGYDAQHDQLRASIVARMAAGDVVRCIDCGVELSPSTLDLGHSEDRTAHRGPQCAPCNRSDGGRKAHAL